MTIEVELAINQLDVGTVLANKRAAVAGGELMRVCSYGSFNACAEKLNG